MRSCAFDSCVLSMPWPPWLLDPNDGAHAARSNTTVARQDRDRIARGRKAPLQLGRGYQTLESGRLLTATINDQAGGAEVRGHSSHCSRRRPSAARGSDHFSYGFHIVRLGDIDMDHPISPFRFSQERWGSLVPRRHRDSVRAFSAAVCAMLSDPVTTIAGTIATQHRAKSARTPTQ